MQKIPIRDLVLSVMLNYLTPGAIRLPPGMVMTSRMGTEDEDEFFTIVGKPGGGIRMVETNIPHLIGYETFV